MKAGWNNFIFVRLGLKQFVRDHQQETPRLNPALEKYHMAILRWTFTVIRNALCVCEIVLAFT